MTWDEIGHAYGTEFGDAALPSRFWDKVRLDDSGCWIWIAAKASWRRGYGYYWHDKRVRRAHRVAYEVLIGSIPEGLGLDHLCRRTECVNPTHLEPVTQKVNNRRGANAVRTHCIAGHAFTLENTYRTPEGWRQCKACARRRYQESRARLRIGQAR